MMVLENRTLGRWLSSDGRALKNEIWVLYKRDPESSSAPSATSGHSKKAVYEPGSRLSADTESVRTLILDFPASETVRKHTYTHTHTHTHTHTQMYSGVLSQFIGKEHSIQTMKKSQYILDIFS